MTSEYHFFFLVLRDEIGYGRVHFPTLAQNILGEASIIKSSTKARRKGCLNGFS